MTRTQDMLIRIAVAAAMALLTVGLTSLFSAQHSTPHTSAASHLSGDPFTAMADAWSGNIDYAPAYAALDPLTAVDNADHASLFDPQDDYWGLPRTNGFEEVAAYCAACHSLRIVMQQRQSRDGWDYLLNWMVEKQGMAPPLDEDRALLLDYLAREFSAE